MSMLPVQPLLLALAAWCCAVPGASQPLYPPVLDRVAALGGPIAASATCGGGTPEEWNGQRCSAACPLGLANAPMTTADPTAGSGSGDGDDPALPAVAGISTVAQVGSCLIVARTRT